jgi:putative hemolysin
MGSLLSPLSVALFGLHLGQNVIVAGGILTLAVLMVLSAFFSSSEIAMFSLARHRIDVLRDEGRPGAETVAALKEDPHRLLVTILVGNNLVNIAMSSIATALVGFYVTNSGVAVLISTLGVTALVLLFGESAPKSYAVENTEPWALTIAGPLKWSERLLYPLVVLFDYLTRAVNRVTGGRAAIETSYVTRSEIQDMIKTGEREGVIEEDEREMLQRIFRFNNTIAKEVMTPRLDMTAVSKDDSIEEAIQTCTQAGHERIPVYESELDNVIGVVSLEDLVREYLYGESEDLDLEDVMKPTLHVPESKNVDELLQEMQDERVQLVVVIDEFGTTEGLITTEDIIEEIVGEILEGEEELPIDFVDDDTVSVRGEVNIEEVNEALGIDLPEGEEFETIAGFIFNRAGRLVEEGETFRYQDVELTAERVENTRIMQARVTHATDREGEDADLESLAADGESQ